MPLSDIVKIVVTTQNPGVTEPGFGVTLILSHTATWVERTRTYGVLSDVAADFDPSTPEYQMAAKAFSQSPAPGSVMIGRAANHPTQAHVIGLVGLGPVGTKYQVRVNNMANGGNSQYATYTSVAGDTNDTIIAGLVTAINALPGRTLTAAATGTTGAHVATLTANGAGTFNGIEVYDATPGTVGQLMTLTETTPDNGVVADLTALAAASSDWYGLAHPYQSAAIIALVSGWTEANGKLYVPVTADTAVVNNANGVGTDIGQTLAANDYARTAPMFHPRNDEFAGIAEIGKFFPVNPGGDNWRLKTLAGVTPASYTPTQIANLKAKRMNFYYTLGGVSVVGGDGKVAANEYIDVIRFRDYWVADVQTRLANLLIQNNKVPYTDDGVALVEAQVRAANQDGIDAGGIAANPRPTVTVPLVAKVSSSDKQARQLNGVNTSWELAGALNKLTVNAQVSA